MMDDPELLFSPWFRIIVQKWVLGGTAGTGTASGNSSKKGWWDDLNLTMNTDTFVDVENVHCFDPPTEHMGGGGDAGPLFGNDPAGDGFDTEEQLVGDAS